MLHMSAQCYEHRFGYCTNAKTCFNVHFRPILAERRVLLAVVKPANSYTGGVFWRVGVVDLVVLACVLRAKTKIGCQLFVLPPNILL